MHFEENFYVEADQIRLFERYRFPEIVECEGMGKDEEHCIQVLI